MNDEERAEIHNLTWNLFLELLKKHGKKDKFQSRTGRNLRVEIIPLRVKLMLFFEKPDINILRKEHFKITKNAYKARRLIEIGNSTEQGRKDNARAQELLGVDRFMMEAHHGEEFDYQTFMAKTKLEKNATEFVLECAPMKIVESLENYFEFRNQKVLLSLLARIIVLDDYFLSLEMFYQEAQDDKKIQLYIKKYKDEN